MRESKLTTDMVNEAASYIFRNYKEDLPNERYADFKTGREGYINMLRFLIPTFDKYKLREGMYSLEKGFLGFEYKGVADSFRAVDVTNDDDSHSYFIDKIVDEWCVATENITKEEFLKLIHDIKK